jgi:hypothetical protein
MTHEPQFYSNYWNHVPDHWNRLDTALNHLAQNNYTPVWGTLIKEEDL